VTIEDILEEIVGEITDEYDVERPPVERLDDDRIRVSARLPSRTSANCSMWSSRRRRRDRGRSHGSGARPGADPGATADVAGLTLEAEGTTGRRNRIDTVLVTRQREEPAEEKHDEERQTADA
jgi:CBS domain containing-hemolysin-like protein